MKHISGLHVQGRALRDHKFFQEPCCFHHWKAKALHSHREDMIPSQSRDLQGSYFPAPIAQAEPYPSASSMGSGGAWREADGRTVLVPRDTRSCSVFVDREAIEMGWSKVVVMPVVTVRL